MDVIFYIIGFGILLAIPVLGLMRQEKIHRSDHRSDPARDGIRPEPTPKT